MSKAKAKADKKEEFRKQMTEYEPVFKLKVLGASSALSRYIGNIENKDQLRDESIELDTKSGALEMENVGKYEIIGRACGCNIPGSYMLKYKKYPVYYITMLYATQLVSGYLFNIYLYFTVDEATSRTLILPKNYLNRMMSGTYTIELTADEGFLTFVVEKKRPEIELTVMEKYSDLFESMTEDEKEELDSKINLEVEQQLDTYRKMFDPIELGDRNFSRGKILKRMESIYKSESFKEMIDLCLEFRENERREKMCGDQSYAMPKPPKRIINLKEFKDDPSKIDDYINNLSSNSDDSDNSDDE